MVIVFLGPPGVGKGTQCRRLASALGLPHLSTGDMFRQVIQAGDPSAEQLRRYLTAGQLVPDDIVMQFVCQRLSQPEFEKGCLFDGFPRTLGQARQLDQFLAVRQRPIHVVLALDAAEPVLVERLLRRAEVESRMDDTLTTIRARLQVYRAETMPLMEYYRQRGLLEVVSGEGTPEEVFAHILDALQHRFPALALQPGSLGNNSAKE